MRLQAITLDLDDTLWPVMPVIEAAELALQEWLARRCPEAAAVWPLAAMRALRDAVHARHPELSHDYTSLRQIALREVLLPYGHDEHAVAEAFEVFHDARNRVSLYPDVNSALARLAQRVPLVSLSNGNACLRRIGIDGRFHAQVCARSHGRAKPDRGIFLAACAAAGSDPAATLHIGDHPEQDVLGALDAGLQAGWINRSGMAWPLPGTPPRAFACLGEVADYVEALSD